jgi:Mrp family chromosome partitioning ATPase
MGKKQIDRENNIAILLASTENTYIARRQSLPRELQRRMLQDARWQGYDFLVRHQAVLILEEQRHDGT